VIGDASTRVSEETEVGVVETCAGDAASPGHDKLLVLEPSL